MDVDALFEAAKAAQKKAYAPYSKFRVGAAICTPDGTIYAGSNVENAAYPQGSCAEASAISAMIGGGDREIATIAVLGDGDDLVTPCGGCRQRIREFARPETAVRIYGPDGFRKEFTLDELLPYSFGPAHLGQ